MKKLLLCILALAFFAQAFAQSSVNVETAVSTSTTGGRYEFLQSTIVRKSSFLLDKYSGRIWQMVKDRNDNTTFESVYREQSSKEVASSKINFQLYMGGMMAKDCFLIDLNNGTVWQLLQDPSDGTVFFGIIWEP